MVRANERLSVLSAEAPIHQPLMTDGSAFFQLQEEMRNAFESTVVDLPRHMLIQYPHMVHDAHVAIVVAELTLADVIGIALPANGYGIVKNNMVNVLKEMPNSFGCRSAISRGCTTPDRIAVTR